MYYDDFGSRSKTLGLGAPSIQTPWMGSHLTCFKLYVDVWWFGYLSKLDTYIWVLCGLWWFQEWIPRSHLITVLSIIIDIIFLGAGVAAISPLLSTKIFTLIVNKMFTWATKIMRKVVMTLVWICSLLCIDYVFCKIEKWASWKR